MALDDSGISLASSDPNSTIDQVEDGGASFDYSAIMQTGATLGTEIASAISGNPIAVPQTSPIYATGIAPYPGARPPMSQTTKLLVAALFLGGVVWFIHSMN